EGEYEVAGVVSDGKYLFIGEEPRPFFFLPLAQNYRSVVTLQVRTAGDPMGVVASVRQVVAELDRDLPVYDVKTMRSHLHDGIAFVLPRLGATLVGTF